MGVSVGGTGVGLAAGAEVGGSDVGDGSAVSEGAGEGEGPQDASKMARKRTTEKALFMSAIPFFVCNYAL